MAALALLWEERGERRGERYERREEREEWHDWCPLSYRCRFVGRGTQTGSGERAQTLQHSATVTWLVSVSCSVMWFDMWRDSLTCVTWLIIAALTLCCATVQHGYTADFGNVSVHYKMATPLKFRTLQNGSILNFRTSHNGYAAAVHYKMSILLTFEKFPYMIKWLHCWISAHHKMATGWRRPIGCLIS